MNAPHLPDPTEVADGELRKSGATRRRILDAGVALLAEGGYKRLSTPAVAERAGLTRAAMLYHFPSRRALVEAIARHVTRRRIALYEAAIAALPHDALFSARAVDLAWEQLRLPEFAAFTELALAARTDAELAGIMRPAMAAFDEARHDAAQRIFPGGVRDAPGFDLRRDVARFLLEGMAMQDGIARDRDARMAAVRRFLRLLVASPEGAALVRRAVEDAGA